MQHRIRFVSRKPIHVGAVLGKVLFLTRWASVIWRCRLFAVSAGPLVARLRLALVVGFAGKNVHTIRRPVLRGCPVV